MIILTISDQKANIVGKISSQAIKTLQLAQYSVIRQEGFYGFTGSLTVPLEPQHGLNWQGVKNCLEICGFKVQIKA